MVMEYLCLNMYKVSIVIIKFYFFQITAMLEVLNEKVLHTNDKVIIVSQWPTFLQLIASQLKKNNINFNQLDGSVPVHKRIAIVDEVNNPNSKLRVSKICIRYHNLIISF